MNFKEMHRAQAPAAERQAVPYQPGSGWETPIPPSADVEYANRLGIEYFSLMGECGQGVLRPRTLGGNAKLD